LAQLVVEVAKAPRAGGLRAALANLLGDPDRELLHAARSSGVWIDATGAIREPPPQLATTALVRDGHEVALLCHRPGLLDDRRVVGEIEESVRLGLDNERLQGELRGQLAHLSRSRAAVLTTGEAERRLLERNLHDGAQQRLAAFSFALGVAQHNAASDAAPALARAQGEVQAALTELRELAHGLYPIALSEGGLATAVESLHDRRPGLRVIELPAERLPPSIEETAYVAIASLADAWSPAPFTVCAVRNDEHIVITLETPAGMPTETLELDDRVEALGGTLAFETTATRQTRVTVDLPCA
jgi:signal transduction histidine kinase